jgi:hypothetical protein
VLLDSVLLAGACSVGILVGYLIWHAQYCARCRGLMKIEDVHRTLARKKNLPNG